MGKSSFIKMTLTLVVFVITSFTTRSQEVSVNSVSFKYETTASGDYYASFWLLPAQYADGKFTTFTVYVNGDYAGVITPNKGNWQSCSIDGNSPLRLKKGVNTVIISTPAPEVPEVERVFLTQNVSEVGFSPENYENFINRITNGELSYEMTNSVNSTSSPITNDEPEVFSNVPLYYSFHKTFEFTEGQEIFITSNSDIKHIIDMIYIGYTGQTPVLPGEPINSNVNSFGIINPNYFKPQRVNFVEALPAEMQGLNWKGNSEVTLNSNIQIATIRVVIPKDGFYLVRLRSTVNYLGGIADLNVNGNYFYQDCPFTLSYVNYSMDTLMKYVTFTQCADQFWDDPMLFIHDLSSNGDHIVAFNDDCRVGMINDNSVSTFDGYIYMKYLFPTEKISVSSYGSYNQSSTCRIYAGFDSLPRQKNIPELPVAPSFSHHRFSLDNDIVMDYSVSSKALTISSSAVICSIEICGIDGYRYGKIDIPNEVSVTLPVSELNIISSGIYIVKIETDEGFVSRKIVIN